VINIHSEYHERALDNAISLECQKILAEVAKKIGIDEETVRIRIQSLKQSGFLLGWRLILNANLLGRESHILVLELLDSKRRIEQSLKLAKWTGLS
jgi:DNA-binding Lrp family transcriptional regulator